MKNKLDKQVMKCVEHASACTCESSLSIEDESCETFYTAISNQVPNSETKSSFYIRSPKKVQSYEKSKCS